MAGENFYAITFKNQRESAVEMGIVELGAFTHNTISKNGLVYPFVIYRSDFGGEKHAYSLLNVNVEAEKVEARVELEKYE